MNPIWGNAVGGIKLMVAEDQAQEAFNLLNELRQEYKKNYACPKCNSHNIEYVSTPRKALNWFTALGSFFIGDYALSVEKVYHCFNCSHEFPEDQAVTTEQAE
jgi:DNA-directed RNA polymerase subunit RPC12/RpoP